MNLFLTALIVASFAVCLSLGWRAWLFPSAERFQARGLPGLYAAAFVLALAARHTFAAGTRDGLVIGLMLWLAVRGVESAGRAGRLDWPRDGYWLLALPLMGALSVWLTRLPSLMEFYYNP